MKGFITALQFLTRIRVSSQYAATPEEFGRSVKFFPLVGAFIGAVLFGFNYLAGDRFPFHTLAALFIVGEILLTGGLHCDGLMDTADGIFSVRSRDKMLEIMKDSRVGAYGVTAFGLCLLLKFSLLLDLLARSASEALFVMPLLGRFAMVVAVTIFPYARPAGMGKAFADFAGIKSLLAAAVVTLIVALPLGAKAVIGLLAATIFALVFCRYVTGILGGLTGDVYGAVAELAELVALAVYLTTRNWVPPGLFYF